MRVQGWHSRLLTVEKLGRGSHTARACKLGLAVSFCRHTSDIQSVAGVSCQRINVTCEMVMNCCDGN